MLDTVVMSGDDVCCSVVFGTLVGVFVFSVMWSELLMTSAISCPLWSSVYECQRVECAFTSPVRTECGMFVMYYMQCCMSVSAVGRRLFTGVFAITDMRDISRYGVPLFVSLLDFGIKTMLVNFHV